MLKELHTFASRPENVREVYLVRFNEHRPYATQWGKCNNMIFEAVRESLCLNKTTSCPAIYQPFGSEEPWPTVAELLRYGHRYVIMTEGFDSRNTASGAKHMFSQQVRSKKS